MTRRERDLAQMERWLGRPPNRFERWLLGGALRLGHRLGVAGPARARRASTTPAAASHDAGAEAAQTTTRRVGRRHRGRALLVGGVALLALAVATVGMVMGGERRALPASVAPRLPDLVMAPIQDVNPSVTGHLDKALRFGAMIANIGEGDFLVSAHRSGFWSNDWQVFQEFEERDGSRSQRATTADLVYGGDTHDHWHVRAVEAHRLERIETGEVLTEVVKQGFCFYDTDAYRPELAGAPPVARYTEAGCDGPIARSIAVGLSVGWGDDYPWHMMDQRMQVADIPDGTYRLREVADPFDWFLEADETNNETWVDIELKTSGPFVEVRVVGRSVDH